MPKVSIVLPVYNGEKYIRESIDSIISQSFTDWELIIVNDCSQDSTLEIIQEYEKKDSRVHCHTNETNLKLPKSLNVGFMHAKGEFLTWTSDDNRYKPNALEEMVCDLESDRNCGLVYYDMDIIDDDGKFIKAQNQAEPCALFLYNPVCACFLYTRDVMKEIGQYDTELFLIEDYDYWIRIYKKFNIKHIPKNLYEYRWNTNSLTQTRRKEVSYATARLKKKHLDFILEHLSSKRDILALYISLIENDLKPSEQQMKLFNEKYPNIDMRRKLSKLKKKVKNICGRLKNRLMRTNFSYPAKWQINKSDKILILSPHQDDESIGCGGLLSIYGKQCDIVLLTDGRHGNPEWTKEFTVYTRNSEFKNAVFMTGAKIIKKLEIEDSKLSKNAKKTKWLSAILNNYQYVVIPNIYELHPDHAIVKKIIDKNKSLFPKFKLVYYEVWQTLATPTHYIDISGVIEKKRQLISCYKSQLKHIDYASRIMGLNHYRAILYGADYVEMYEICGFRKEKNPDKNNTDFINHKIRENSVLIVEPNKYHSEILPSYVKYFQDLGYKVDLFLRHENLSDLPFSDTTGINIFEGCPAHIRNMLKLKQKIKEYEYVFFSSSAFWEKGPTKYSYLQYLKFEPKSKHGVLLVEHNIIPYLERYKEEKYLKQKRLFSCSGMMDVPMLAPCYYGNFDVSNKSRDGKVCFIAAGSMNSYSKNITLLFESVEKLVHGGITNFQVILDGIGLPDVPESIKKYVVNNGRVQFAQLYSDMAKSDFILFLLDNNCEFHDRYKQGTTTGALNLSLGFKKPAILNEVFAKAYGLRSENAIIYNDNNLHEAMRHAIELNENDYLKIQNSLRAHADKVYNDSLDNLRKAVMRDGVAL